jgi:hypothetical protein
VTFHKTVIDQLVISLLLHNLANHYIHSITATYIIATTAANHAGSVSVKVPLLPEIAVVLGTTRGS